MTPGSVSLLGLVNDPQRRVRLIVDADYYPAEAYLCHPLVNTATLVLTHAALLRFLESTAHVPQVLTIPGQK